MKKLFFAALFMIGAFTMSQAQTFDYYLYNSSPTDTWNFGLDDAGPTGAIYELNILPGQYRTGSFNNFAFQLEWKAEDSNNCGIYQNIPGPTPVVIAPTSCAGTNVTYQVGTIVPFVHYYLKLQFD